MVQLYPLVSQIGLAGVIEFVVGILLIIGLWVQWGALVAFVEMIIAYVQAHSGNGLASITNGGELALLYAACFLIIMTQGAGKVAVEQWLKKS